MLLNISPCFSVGSLSTSTSSNQCSSAWQLVTPILQRLPCSPSLHQHTCASHTPNADTSVLSLIITKQGIPRDQQCRYFNLNVLPFQSFHSGTVVLQSSMVTARATWCHTTWVSWVSGCSDSIHSFTLSSPRFWLSVHPNQKLLSSWSMTKIIPRYVWKLSGHQFFLLISYTQCVCACMHSNPVCTEEPPGQNKKVGDGEGTYRDQSAPYREGCVVTHTSAVWQSLKQTFKWSDWHRNRDKRPVQLQSRWVYKWDVITVRLTIYFLASVLLSHPQSWSPTWLLQSLAVQSWTDS